MNLLSIESISKSYSERMLLSDISFGINDEDKIGLIGINGTGKSTLLKIVAGLESSDSGRIIMRNNLSIAYLPQNPIFNGDVTVIEQVFKGSSPIMQLLKEYEYVISEYERTKDDILQEKIVKLSQKMDEMNAWKIESDARSILTRLGIFDFDCAIKMLSGGQKKRVAMASALIDDVDLLILDEPTNHIDSDTVEWLEEYLNKRKGALIMVTHDRYFLDRVTNRIIELDSGKLYSYPGNYSAFLEHKIERDEQDLAVERKRQNLFRKELEWIKRGAKARSTKQKARIDRFENLKENAMDTADNKIEISSASSRLGKKVIELHNITKCFSNKKLISDFSYTILRNDRVGVIGSNGIGKSTLLNIIDGILNPDNGSIEKGETVRISHFTQENSKIDESLRVIDYIKDVAEYVKTSDGSIISASMMLERFLFSSDMQWTPISKLSGGEKRRLYLLKILMSSPNVLLLDEPTNDLDIVTLEILEDYLDDFEGAVIAVSHDRYFIDRVCDKIFVFEGAGVISQYTGNYFDYKEYKIEHQKGSIAGKPKKNGDKNLEYKKKNSQLKFTFKEQKEYEHIDELIENVEQELKKVNADIDVTGSNFELLQKLLAQKMELEIRQDEITERWIYLNDLADEIKKQ